MSSLNITIDGNQFSRGQKAFVRNEDRQVLLAGGYGAGKTLALAVKAFVLHCMNPGVPGLIVAPTWRTLTSVTLRRFMSVMRRILPPHRMPKWRDRTGESYLDFGDEAPIFLRTATNPDSFDGLDVGWACGDEARYWSERAYNVLQGRVRVKCPRPQLALVSTPQMGWMSNEFDSGKTNRELIVSGTKENEHNLAPGFIENIRASYSERMWRALIDGEFTILEGAVFEHFDPGTKSKWLVDIEPTRSWLSGKRSYLAVDPGFRRSAWIWIAETGATEWTVYDQLMLDSTTDIAAVKKVNEAGWPIDEIWFDPAGVNTQSFEGASTKQALRLIKCRTPAPLRTIEGATREIVFGVDKLRTLLGGDGLHPIRLKFCRSLLAKERKWERGIVKDLGALVYPERKDRRPMDNHPLKDGVTDHSTDCARYWAVGRWLCNPTLRQSDHELAKLHAPGWKSVTD